MDTRQIVTDYFDCINRGDWDGWLLLFAEDAVMEDSVAPRMEGIEALRASTVAIRRGFQRFQNRIVDLVVEGEKAVAICRIEAVTADGQSIRSTGANYYCMRGGKIASLSSYHDSRDFVAAAPRPS